MMIARALTLVAVVLALAGCNYRVSSSLDGGATRTIAITTIENQVYPPRAGLEYALTRRLKDEIALDRRLRLQESGAEINLRATLVGFEEPTIVKVLDTGLPAEILLRATVVVEASGSGVIGERKRVGERETNVLTRRISVSDSYAPALGEGPQEARERLWRDLAREIIDVVTDREWATSRKGP